MFPLMCLFRPRADGYSFKFLFHRY
jgi:hypothetical protein